MKEQPELVFGRPSWRLHSDAVELAITRDGGHMAPVTFFRDTRRPVQPYYISPWQTEETTPEEPVLRPLRGDFFCCPFGAGSEWKGEKHVTHGEPATAPWRLVGFRHGRNGVLMTLEMETRVRPGRLVKRILLRNGENVVYTQHDLFGYEGPMSLGHHATLAPPAKGRLRISTGPIRFGQVSPRAALAADGAEYYALAPERLFRQLERVPTIWREEPWADASVFPAREGFVDILALVARSIRGMPAWTCAVAADEGWAWFALRNPAMLPTTLLWMENRGRHAPPWSGRNVCIGLEDVCGYFALGLAASAGANPWRSKGIPTAVNLTPRRPTRVSYIQGVFRVPRGFERAAGMKLAEDGVEFTADSGAKVLVRVRHDLVLADPSIESLLD